MFARRIAFALLAPILALVVQAAPSAAEGPLAVGDPISELQLDDQFGVTRVVGDDVRIVLYSRDMKSGKVIEGALEDTDSSYLGARGAVVVADIHGMPGLITTLFALPKLRGRTYPMLLDRDGAPTADLPFEEDHVTWLTLDERVIREIRHIDAAEVLRSELDREAGRPGVAGEAPEAEILGVEARRYAAMREADLDALDPLLAEELVFTHANGSVQTKQELLDALGSGELRYLDVQLDRGSLRVYGETVVLTGISRLQVEAGEQRRSLALRTTSVYVRREGGWRLVAYQSTSLP